MMKKKKFGVFQREEKKVIIFVGTLLNVNNHPIDTISTAYHRISRSILLCCVVVDDAVAATRDYNPANENYVF